MAESSVYLKKRRIKYMKCLNNAIATANNLEIDYITNANNKFSLDSDGNLYCKYINI